MIRYKPIALNQKRPYTQPLKLQDIHGAYCIPAVSVERTGNHQITITFQAHENDSFQCFRLSGH